MLGERGRYWVGWLMRRDRFYPRQRVYGGVVAVAFTIALAGALMTGSSWWILLLPVGILLSYRLLR